MDANSEVSAPDLLNRQISELRISSQEATILTHFAQDEDGWRMQEAAGILAEWTKLDKEDCYRAIGNLIAGGWLTRNGDDPDAAIQFNWPSFDIPTPAQWEIQRKEPTFTPHGSPLSKEARETLEELYQTPEKLYLALGATPPERFPNLEQRAAAGRATVLLMPREKDVRPLESRKLYGEVLDGWRKWLLIDDRHEYVEMRITFGFNWFIHGSALSEDQARFTIHHRPQKPNKGELIEAAGDTSLYRLVENGYRDAMLFSVPWWKVHRGAFARSAANRVWPTLVILVAIAVAVLAPTTAVGVCANTAVAVVAAGAVRGWTVRPKLFES
jgi:hypothetical protein